MQLWITQGWYIKRQGCAIPMALGILFYCHHGGRGACPPHRIAPPSGDAPSSAQFIPGRPRLPAAVHTPAQHAHLLALLSRFLLSSSPLPPSPVRGNRASRSALLRSLRLRKTCSLAHAPLSPCPAPILQSPTRRSPRCCPAGCSVGGLVPSTPDRTNSFFSTKS